ncbi:MAG: hypothetical protein ABW061_21030 [Polyangiaceae bacterium]
MAPLEAFLFAVAALVAFKLINGQINMRGLLIDQRTGLVSSLCVQKLLTTITVAASFAAAIASSTDPHHLPSVSREMLVLLGGSNGVLVMNRGFRRILEMIFASSIPPKDPET